MTEAERGKGMMREGGAVVVVERGEERRGGGGQEDGEGDEKVMRPRLASFVE